MVDVVVLRGFEAKRLYILACLVFSLASEENCHRCMFIFVRNRMREE